MTARADNSVTEGDIARARPAASEQADGGPESAGQRGATDRVTVALIPQARAGLQRLQDRTSMSKTDITNRAIALYEFIEAQVGAGRELLIRDGSTGEIQRVLLI
jgi:hypothetical protein